MKKILSCATAVMIVGAMTQAAFAGLISNGDLSVTIRNDNGAIDTALFDISGVTTDFFNAGTPVSDFGFQVRPVTGGAAFRMNTTTGITQIPVAVSPTNVVTGTLNLLGSNISFTRSYVLLAGLDVLRVTTSILNNGAAVGLDYFDTFDPDQGLDLGAGFGTFNDVFGLGGGTVGQARINSGSNQHTVLLGSLDPNAVIAAGSPFQIASSSDLNSFLTSPFDGNDNFADQGIHIGWRLNLGAGQSYTTTYDLAFGLNPTAAQNAFLAANTPVATVPEPASAALFGLGACGVGFIFRRRRVQA